MGSLEVSEEYNLLRLYHRLNYSETAILQVYTNSRLHQEKVTHLKERSFP